MKHLIYYLPVFLLLFISCENDESKRPYGTIIEVPNEVETIKEAIEIAQPLDTILLHKGQYFEWNIKIDKPILLTSDFLFENDSNSIDQTIINANQEARVFLVSNITDTLRLNGLTIKNGFATENINYVNNLDLWGYDGAGIACFFSNLKLTNLIISDNMASGGSYMKGTGGGLLINNSSVYLQNVEITNNEASYYCGGVYCNNSEFYGENIKINKSSNIGMTTIAFIDSYIDIKNSIFEDNPYFHEDYYNLFFVRCNGIIEELSVVNGSAFMTESSINEINCNINWH